MRFVCVYVCVCVSVCGKVCFYSGVHLEFFIRHNVGM